MDIFCLYPGAKRKAFTLSYDDGVCQDRRLVALFNQYKVKATFNLNSGRQSYANGWTHACGLEIRHLPAEEIVALYAGHEVAVHTVNHPHLESLSPAEIIAEVRNDKRALEERFGAVVEGMAYPFGTYDHRIPAILEKEGILYARTTKQTLDFSIPDEFYAWDSSCHHNYPGLLPLAQEFLSTDQELALFYVWGHSYEFDVDNNWDNMEDLLTLVSGKEDTWYATNLQICRYLTAMRELKVQGGKLVNPTNMPLWVEVDGEVQVI